MTLDLDMNPDLERRLLEEAARQHRTADEYALRLLDRHLPPVDRRAELVALLESWIGEGDAEEQRQTGDYLVHALDEDRLSDRKLFPPELKGVTW